MPRKCCVYGCKSNYKSTEVRYSVFSFPRDETLRREWIRKFQIQISIQLNTHVYVKNTSPLKKSADFM